ncbi:hypothetical protein KJ966_14520 [bacterium]|nr:hypothetical protein [bacterium]
MSNNSTEENVKRVDLNSYRTQLVQSAKVFKSNWIQFGEHLTKVASDKLYQEWGFKSFEDYCREEIRIKKLTAMKLTNAYFFMTKEDPEIFKHSNLQNNLDLDAVAVLQKAKSDDNCSPDFYSELRSSALDKGQSGPSLARKFKKMIQEETQTPDQNFHEQNLKLINRLQSRIKPLDNVPSKFKEYLEEMAEFFSDQES